MKSNFNISGQTVPDLVSASLFEFNFDNKLQNMDFKLYWNSLIFFN